MSPRVAALCLFALAPLTACTWEGRPDGADAVHTASDGYFDDGNEATDTPLSGTRGLPPAADVVEPLDTQTTLPSSDGAVTLPPTTGTSDDVSATAEALTPGGDL